MITTKEKRRVLLAVEYIGGYDDSRKSTGMLSFYESYVKYTVLLRNNIEILFNDIKTISVESPEDTSKRVTATRLIAIGIFAFAFKKKVKESYVVFELKDGREVIFHINGLSTMDVRAKLSTTIAKVNNQ